MAKNIFKRKCYPLKKTKTDWVDTMVQLWPVFDVSDFLKVSLSFPCCCSLRLWSTALVHDFFVKHTLLNVGYKISKKKNQQKTHLVYNEHWLLEFIVAKFNICSTFLSSLYRLKIKNCTVYLFWNKTFMWHSKQTHKHVQTKMQQACGKNKLMLEKTKL